MALVDYSSDSNSDSNSEQDAAGPVSKKRKLSTATAQSGLPPLPSSFHDLYASTVRLSNTDDPSLHQGRKRQIPHIAGNWPSHLYIEWHPSPSEHELLSTLLSTLSSRLAGPRDTGGEAGSPDCKIRGFLTSDLGAPLPLHISLSRPLSLTSAQKDSFLEQLRSTISRPGVGEFELLPTSLEWHRTTESSRSFLVLRVVSSRPNPDGEPQKNVELSTLLRRCNALCKSYGQPELYALTGSENAAADIGRAFHVSVAWSFEEPTEELVRVTENVSKTEIFREELQRIRIKINGVKVKIGNTVTHLPLSMAGTGQSKNRRHEAFFGF